MSKLSEQLHGGIVTDDDISQVRAALLFEEPEKQRKLIRFFCLLVLAAAIATCGLLADSVATVIGAMIVAPLMLPIMGVAFGVGLGDREIIFESLLISVLGIAAAIAIGFLITWGFRDVINIETNTQVISRTSPRLVDLFAALATGLAGAFATGRKDVSDTLPGVAIAISLVPPLANMGILFATDRADLAFGSLLLFVTNYLAILLTGAFMFSIMGYPRAYHAHHSRGTKRATVAFAVLLLALIIMPLYASSQKVIRGSLVENRAVAATIDWLADSDYRIVSVNATNEEVRVIVTGAGTLPPEAGLQDLLRGRLFQLPVTLEIVPQTRVRFTTATSGNR